jgi:CO/xanthine dehydrogenase FAD-binding subunit
VTAAHPDVPPVVAEAIATIASPQVRNAATVGGNLAQAKRCWFFRNGFDCYKRNGPLSPCYAVTGDHRFQHAVVDGHRCQAVTPSDLSTVFLALDAAVEINRSRTAPVSAFYTGPGETVLRPGELVTAVTVPASALERASAFTKLALYTGDFATASAALSVDRAPGGIWRDVRLVLCGAPHPTRRACAATSTPSSTRTPTRSRTTRGSSMPPPAWSCAPSRRSRPSNG